MAFTGLLLPVGDAHFAIELASVSEVLAGPTLTVVPTAPRAVLGLCNRRGDIVPVLSLAALAGIAGAPTPGERAAPWVAVVDTADGPAGLALTDRPTTADLGEPVAPGEGLGARSVHRVDRDDGHPLAVTLLDPLALLTPAEIAAER